MSVYWFFTKQSDLVLQKSVSEQMSDTDQLVKKKLTALESVGVGIATGVVSATVNLPFWTIKMRKQCDLPFTMDPRVLYKGFPAVLATVVSITTLQIFNISRVESMSSGDTVSSQQRTFSSFIGSISSSLITNPLNIIGTQQHKHNNLSFAKTAKNMSHQLGFRSFWIGLPISAVSESIYISAYYGFFPPLKYYMNTYINNEIFAAMCAAVLAGIPTAVITQPADRIRTMQHQHADEKGKHHFTPSVKKIYRTKGVIGFFSGLIPRTVAITSTVLAAGTTADKMESFYKKAKSS